MSNSKAFETALESGQVVLRAMWHNPTAKRLPITLQFAARVQRDEIDPDFFTGTASVSNPLVAIAGGFGQVFNITALAAWSLEQLEKKMNFDAKFKTALLASSAQKQIMFSDKDAVITAKQLFGVDVSIHVERTTFANPFTKSQTPVSGPNGDNVVEFDGKPLYQHTWLVVGPAHEFDFAGHGTSNESFLKFASGNVASRKPAVVESVVNLDEMFAQ